MQIITGRIALALRMFAVCEKYARKPEAFEIVVSLYGVKAYQPITNKPMGSGLTGRAGRYRPGRSHRVIVPALFEL